ncbi:MAG TPA: hypothetical protein VK808_09220 [Bacteroidia bacterium]|nr:hypothetical protein [Bacteroidia bacterium]
MKNLFLFILAASGINFAQAQTTSLSSMSPSETFAARKGAILEKRFDEVGKVGYLNVQIEYITDLTTNDKLQCIRFDIQLTNNTAGPSALLDTNEVNEIISFMKYISANIINRPPVDPNTEISFTSKYNIQVGCFWQSNSGWTLFIRTDSQNPATETDILQSDVNALLKTFRLAKAEIQKI